MNRRKFIQHLGTFFAVEFFCSKLAVGADKPHALYVGAYTRQPGKFGAAIINSQSNILATYKLPGRGHGAAVSQESRQVVIFARRPGGFALAIDTHSLKTATYFKPSAYTNFCGHGVFSKDGKLLFATENNFEAGTGAIGIYDMKNNYKKEGEFSTYGVGPHEIIMMPDGKTLCVANGGILTHPDTGRTKLNLDSMRSSVVFIDSRRGDLLEKFEVPHTYRRLSLRHMDISSDHTIWLGGQYEGDTRKNVPLIAHVDRIKGLSFPFIDSSAVSSLSNYIGSVACNRDGSHIAFSSPKGNTLLIINAKGSVLENKNIEKVCGLSELNNDFIYSSMNGWFHDSSQKIYWDNHLGKIA